MKPLRHVTAVIAVSAILFTACKKGITTNDKLAGELTTQNSISQALDSIAALKDLQSVVPNYSAATKTDGEGYLDLLKRASGVEPTPCDPHTALFNWLDQQRSDWTQQAFDFALGFRMVTIPADYAYFFENSSLGQSFGVNGEYTQRLTKTFKDLKRFWNIESNTMVMVAMHGSTLRDREKLIKTFTTAYGVRAEDAPFYADIVLVFLNYMPQFRSGNHPFFTFNAYASPSVGAGPYTIIPDKIIMGDGILEAFSSIGFGDVAPQAILAHEYGHQVQFQLQNFIAGTPESTRKMELMADALSAYYLSHARGASMQWKRVKQFLQVFYAEGGCAFNSPSFHGTPNQRMAAAEWAYNLADNAQKQGHILPAREFVTLFEAQLPELVKY